MSHGGSGTGEITESTVAYMRIPSSACRSHAGYGRLIEGLSARIGADHLDHSHVSITQDRYMSRGRIHTEFADLLDRAVRERGDSAEAG